VDLEAHRARWRQDLVHQLLERRPIGICEQRDGRRLGHQLAHQLQHLRPKLDREKGCAGDIACGPPKARHQASLHRISADGEHDRDRGGGLLRRQRRNVATAHENQRHPAPDEIAGEHRQAVEAGPGRHGQLGVARRGTATPWRGTEWSRVEQLPELPKALIRPRSRRGGMKLQGG
jgi:hypothetical protein